MKNQTKIQELELSINSANTATIAGCQLVANICKELYMLIEEDVNNAGCEWMLKGMYSDLINANFSEGFICETKKTTFSTIKEIYNNKILPRL